MTGINASKIIQNLQFVNSFGALKLRAVEDFFDFQNWFRKPGGPPPVEGGGWESDSLRVFNTRQESGNGTRKLRTRSRSVLQYGTRIGDWVPVRLAIRSPFIVIY